jgi:hypothetical protein
MRSWRMRFVIFLACSVVIFLVWMIAAKTERLANSVTGEAEFNSIVRTADGSGFKPFVYRRLLPDSARLVAATVPLQVWNAIDQALEPSTPILGRVGQVLENYFNWQRKDFALLISAHLLVFLSVLGFLYSVCAFGSTQYVIEPKFTTVVGVFFGFALLGGIGPWGSYCYDFPNVLVFTLTLWTIAAERPILHWVLLVLTFYSKETSLLLILAWALAHIEERDQQGFWLNLAAQTAVYALIRLSIYWRFSASPVHEFSLFGRNLIFLRAAAYQMDWFWAILAVPIARLVQIRRQLPTLLARWVLLLPAILLPALLRGWIEERRAYLEMLPIIGLLFLQWATIELGYERLLKPRSDAVEPSIAGAAMPAD